MSASPSFEKVGECLYRNPSSGTYFARVKLRGKEIKQTLATKHLPTARRKLKDFKRDIRRLDLAAGHITLKELTEKFEQTIQHFARETISYKARVLNRVRETWPGGADRLIGKIKPSEAAEFLSRYHGVAGHNQALETIRAMFAMAEADGMIARSASSCHEATKALLAAAAVAVLIGKEQIEKSIRGGVWAYVAAVVAGIPAYVCEGGEVPLTAALIMMDVGIGPAFTFMQASVGTCPPTLIMLPKLIGMKLTVVYLAFWLV